MTGPKRRPRRPRRHGPNWIPALVRPRHPDPRDALEAAVGAPAAFDLIPKRIVVNHGSDSLTPDEKPSDRAPWHVSAFGYTATARVFLRTSRPSHGA